MVKKLGILLLVFLNIGCDQISKDLVRKKVAPMDYIQVINDNFILTNVENTGAMMGIGQSLSPIPKIVLLQIIPVLILLVLLVRILQKTEFNPWLTMAFAFVIGGGVGNLIDRIAYGSVTDFLQIRMGLFKTGIFNMADVSVTIGVLLILFYSLIRTKSSHSGK